ncbi:MAG: hypothetical protein J7K81_05770 [Methanophagales archaeon]|nr:hypothetical protein [Methanophagales archaeon]
MGAVEGIKEEDLKGEVEFVVELDRKAPAYCSDCEVFSKALSQILSKRSSVKHLPISKDGFLLKIV